MSSDPDGNGQRPRELTPSLATAGIDALVDRVTRTLEQVDPAFPFIADLDTGEWTTTPDGNWCGGTWVGLLFLVSNVLDGSEATRLRRDATRYVERLPLDSLRGSMFGGMNHRYAGFRGYDVTGDESLRALGIEGADAICDLYDPDARQVPVGTFRTKGLLDSDGFDSSPSDGDRLSAVDNVYTGVSVLWRAHAETGDEQYRDIGVAHADRHLEWFVEPDGRTCQKIAFDTDSGAAVERYDQFVDGPEECWARGHAWSIAGLADASLATGREAYRDALETQVAYYRIHTPGDLVPRWDFGPITASSEPRDTSAAAIAAYGLVRLSGERSAKLRRTGERILASLVDRYTVTDRDTPERGVVSHGCYNRPVNYATDNELVWTAYYLLYALRAWQTHASDEPSR